MKIVKYPVRFFGQIIVSAFFRNSIIILFASCKHILNQLTLDRNEVVLRIMVFLNRTRNAMSQMLFKIKDTIYR